MLGNPRRREPRCSAASRVRIALWATLLLAFAALLGGCTTNNPLSTLNPKGPAAHHIYDLLVTWLFWPAVVVFFAVEGLLLYAIFRFRGRPGDPLPAQLHGNTRLEVTWTLVPALILTVILAVTFRTQAVLATPPTGEFITVRVIGHQWWWEFQYPDLGVTTANEMHIPVGVPIQVELSSADVIHSYWVPYLAGKMDAIPGRINKMSLQADEAGVYSGQCSEFCGVQHAMMRMLLVAQPQGEFDAWVRNERSIPSFTAGVTPGATPGATAGVTPAAGAASESLVTRGAQVFANGACVTCHAIRGTAAQARVGPELTHVGSRRSIAANTLTNTPENMRRWLRNPQAVKPGNLMPNLNLSDQDVDALVAYLQSLK